MSNLPVLRGAGLNTANNQLSATPEGAFVRADNVVVPYKDRTESRRGQKYEAITFGTGASRAKELAFFGGHKVAQYGSSTLAQDSAGVWADLSGGFTPPDAALLRMKFCEMAQNLYFTTSLGLFLIESLTGTPVAAGIPKAVDDADIVPGLAVAGGWLPNDSAVAYATVWGRKDSNGNVKLGAPSRPLVIANPAFPAAIGGIVRTAAGGSWPAGKVTVTGPYRSVAVGDVLTLSPGEGNFAAGAKTVISVTSSFATNSTVWTYDEAGANVASTAVQSFSMPARSVQVRAYAPPGITTTSGHFVRLYRSRTVTPATAQPGLDLFQVLEWNSSDLGGGPPKSVTFSDKTPEIMLNGAPPLYTSPNFGDGALSANESPPMAKDIFEFDGRMWFLNTTDRHRFTLNMLGVYATAGDAGIQSGDTLTVGGITITFTTGAVGAGQSFLYTAFSTAQNIEFTARAFVYSFNNHASNASLNAFYVSGIDDAPGRILFEERALGGAAFAVYASRQTSWFPNLPTSSTGAPTSDNSRRLNGLSYSKRGQPEAVPLTNYIADIGPKNREAIRALPLRDKIFVFVKDVGIWTVSRSGSGYVATRLDTTAKLLVPDSLVEHSNRLIGLFDQGVCAVSDSGVAILSEPIERDLLELEGAALAAIKAYAFAVSYESDRQYQLWLPSLSTDTVCEQAYVFNSLRNLWTRWVGSRTCGRVNPADGLLYLGDGDANKLRVERKSYDRTDYADESIGVTITAHSGTSVTLSSTAGLTVGDLLYQSAGVRSLITAVVSSTVLTVSSTEGWSNAGAQVLVAIDCKVKWVDVAPGGPGLKKQFRKAHFHFRDFYVNTFAAVFDSDNSTTEGLVVLSSPGFGLTVFGASSFGLAVGTKQRDAEVHPLHQRSQSIRVGCNIREAWSMWGLNGFTLDYAIVGDSTGVT